MHFLIQRTFYLQDFSPEYLNSGNLKFFPKTVTNNTTVSAVETHVVYCAKNKNGWRLLNCILIGLDWCKPSVIWQISSNFLFFKMHSFRSTDLRRTSLHLIYFACVHLKTTKKLLGPFELCGGRNILCVFLLRAMCVCACCLQTKNYLIKSKVFGLPNRLIRVIRCPLGGSERRWHDVPAEKRGRGDVGVCVHFVCTRILKWITHVYVLFKAHI